MMNPIRVRIAPSPTGHPHIGTIWQALLNYAFARRYKGKFMVRIEDTDRQRLVPGAEKELFDLLRWFGLEPDESPAHGGPYGPYRQSERLDLYRHYAEKLVKEGKAYNCTCTPERLAALRRQQQAQKLPPRYDGHCRALGLTKDRLPAGGSVIRLKVPEKAKITVLDLLRGPIDFDSRFIDDQVLLKSDGYPTYHLAVVVDDHLMKITHMVRAEEWLPSAPKNWLLYDYLGWEKPVFVHTPTLRNPDRSKMSKRHGHTAASYYQAKYLKEAILNYLALLGWSHPEGKEFFGLDEFVRLFDLKDLSTSGPVFDEVKLASLNGIYIRQMEDDRLTAELKVRLSRPRFSFFDRPDSPDHPDFPDSPDIPDSFWPQIIPLVKERIKDFSPESLTTWLGFFSRPPDFPDHPDFPDPALAKKQLTAMIKALESGDWKLTALQTTLLGLADHTPGWKRAPFFAVLRLAITGCKISPPLLESMEILGKEECLSRINTALKYLSG